MAIMPISKTTKLKKDLDALRTKFDAVITPCGSRVTCNPPSTDTDADYLVYIPTTSETVVAEAVCHLHEAGWDHEGSEHYQQQMAGDFMSWRRDENNLIITRNVQFWERHKLATKVCAKLNLMNKKDRIVLFQAILYGNTEEKLAHRIAVSKNLTEEISF